MNNQKEQIKLRKRLMPSGTTSLYLDIYVNGKRTYEYLKLYLVPEKNRADKEKNRQTLRFAEEVRAKRMVDLRNNIFGFQSPYKEKTRFYPYYQEIAENRKGNDNPNNRRGWNSCLNHIRIYDNNPNLTFADITPEWIQGFKDYLDNEAMAWASDTQNKREHHPLAQNSKRIYFNKLCACLRQAAKDRIIRHNPAEQIETFKPEEATRMYLTIDEIQQLAATDCPHPGVKAAFLFSCLTGLRRSDIQKLTWGEVHEQGDFTRLIFRQKKTKGQEYLDISPQAATLIGKRKNPDDKVFHNLPSPTTVNRTIQRWTIRADIQKEITFHSARHSFAVMMLDIGIDIYTVSKLLGHRLLNTTQIYAKVLDKNKQAAVMKIPQILNE